MAGNEAGFSSPLFVPQDSPELAAGGTNSSHPNTPFEDLDLGMQFEAPDVDMDRFDDLEDFGNPEPEPVKAGRSIFRLPKAGNTFLVGTQQSPPQASIAGEQSEDVEVRAELIVGRDVSFASPSTLSPLAAFDFDFDFDLDADVFSFGESHMDTEVELPGQDLSVAQLDEDLSIARPHVIREEESEVFPSFATDVGQIYFTFDQPDPHSDFATEASQRQFIIDRHNRDAEREVRQESPFSAQYSFGSPLPSLQPMPEVQAAPASTVAREQGNSAFSSLGSQDPFDLPSDATSLRSESEDNPAPASTIEHKPATSVFSPSSSQDQFDLSPLKPEFEYKPVPTPTTKREPPSSTISPFTSRAERTRRAQLNAIKSEMSDQEPAKVGSMASPQAASARTRAGALKEKAEMEKVTLLSTATFTQEALNEKTEIKQATLPSAATFTQVARTSERLGTPFGIPPKGKAATVNSSVSAQAEAAIDNAFNKLVPFDRVRVPEARTFTYEDVRRSEREQKRNDNLSNQTNSGNNGNNISPNIPSISISQPANNPSMFLPQPTNPPIPNFSNPTIPQTPSDPASLIAAARQQLDDQAQLYRDLENDACDLEEWLTDRLALVRAMRVKSIEELRNALIVIRHRHRQLNALQGMSGKEIVEGGFTELLRPLFVEKEPRAGGEEFARMSVEDDEAGVDVDDGSKTPPFGGEG
ncbi:hypothetical protein Q7P36_002725 [Cladosporium allicinum]